MNTRIIYSLVFLISFTGMAIGLFPAERALPFIKKQAGEPLRGLVLSNLKGTVWRGTADGLQVNGIQTTQLRWRTGFFSLLTGTPKLSLDMQYQDHPQHLVVSSMADNYFRVEDARLQWDFSWLDITLPRTLNPGGVITAHINAIDIQDTLPVAAQGKLQWQNATLGATSLGDYTVILSNDATHDPSPIHGKITSTTESPIQANGQFNLDPSGQYTLDLTLKITNRAAPELRQTLGMLGRIGSDNAITLHEQGHIKQWLPTFN